MEVAAKLLLFEQGLSEATMARATFDDEINHLFDRLVRDSWARPRLPVTHPAGDLQWNVELPLARLPGALAIVAEGSRISVRLASEGEFREQQQAIVLSEPATIAAVEATIESDRLRLQLRLRPRPRGKHGD